MQYKHSFAILLYANANICLLYYPCRVKLLLNNMKDGDHKMKKKEQTFGEYIREKRIALEPHISLRKMAELLFISPVYMSNIETGMNPAPKNNILEHLAKILKLDKKQSELMYELAAKSKTFTAIPGDLPEYISSNEYARIALRVAQDVDATDNEWQEFIKKLQNRKEKDN